MSAAVKLRRKPATLDLEVTAGDGFPLEFQTKLDLSGYAVQVTARRDVDLTSAKLWDLSTANTRVTITALGGTPAKWAIRFALNPTETRAVIGGLVWDMQLTPPAPNNIPRTYVSGEVRVVREVSA
jgi:hypothetical protein